MYSLVTKHSYIWSCGGHHYLNHHSDPFHLIIMYYTDLFCIVVMNDPFYMTVCIIPPYSLGPNTSPWHVPCDGTVIMLHFSTKVDSTNTQLFPPTLPRKLVVWVCEHFAFSEELAGASKAIIFAVFLNMLLNKEHCLWLWVKFWI